MKFKNITSLNKKQKGFSIVELMVAIFIGIIVLTGLVQVFDTSSKMNRTQNGLARIQENGRYAISLLKQTIEQTGYQYCMGETNAGTASGAQPTKVAWDIKSTPFIPGFGTGPFDPAYLLHGHECNASSCSPSLTSLGSNTAAGIPDIGTGDGERLAGTDIITVRYISGPGREIASVSGDTLTLTDWSEANPPYTSLTNPRQILVIGCMDEKNSPEVVTQTNNTTSSLTVTPNPKQTLSLAKAFDLERDFSTVTYYVANNVVNDRDIPTLYSNVNGTTNAIIEGVDAFDILYGVKDSLGNMRYLDAAGVQGLTGAGCWPDIIDDVNDVRIPNAAGCGWRSVVTIEVHLLLNSIYNSTNNDNEKFRYSQLGGDFYDQTDLTTGINHYSMHRREFSTSIGLKNIMP